MAKIVVTLPDEVLQDIEQERQAAGQNRSEFVRGAVLSYLRLKREKAELEARIQECLKLLDAEEEPGWAEAATPTGAGG